MMEAIKVTLPTGFTHKGKWYRSAKIRPLDGADECRIAETAPVQLPAERITTLLECCLTRLGPMSKINAHEVRSLTLGDRDALLLHLRRLMLGNTINSVIVCPNTECNEKMDLEFRVDDVLVTPNLNVKEIYSTNIEANGSTYMAKFRLPTGADLEAVAKKARVDPEVASKRLLARCIQELEKDGNKRKIQGDPPSAVAEALSKRMAELDPQAEIILNLKCPSCNRNFLANFDIADFFFKELNSDSLRLYREVHLLAFHYHWSEKDILKMSRSRRQMYLELLTDALNPE